MKTAVLFDLDDALTDRAASIREYAHRLCFDFAVELEPVGPSRLGNRCVAFLQRK